MWMADAAVLNKTHKVYAIDIIGEPGKSSEARPLLAGANYTQWLVDVLDNLGIGKAALAGNSLGGWMSLSLATQFPKRVTALILIAPSGLASIRSSFIFKAIWCAMHGEKGAGRLNTLVFGDVHLSEDALAFGQLLHEHYIPRALQKMPVFSDAELKRLDMPVLFFGGANDPLIKIPKSAKRLRNLVPHADIRVLEKAAHTLINLGNDISAFLKNI